MLAACYASLMQDGDASAEQRTGLHSGTFARFQLGIWSLVTTTMLLPAYGHPAVAWVDAVRWIVEWTSLGLLLSTGIGLALSRLPTEHLRGLRAVMLTVGVSLLASALWTGLEWALVPLLGGDPFLPPGVTVGRHFVMSLLRGSFLLGFWTALFFVMLLVARVQQERERAALARATAHEAQLELLRSQLNPHFLFNALNSVVALVGENPKAAQGMVRDVSTLLRRALDADGKKDTTLAQELDFVRLYLKCEQVRFEDKLHVEFDVAPGLEGLWVPPMVLHPLVENAVKHGMRQLSTPSLRVRVSARRAGAELHLEVANTGRLVSPGPDSSGIGLRNVRERLAQLFPGRSRFEVLEREGEVVAAVSLPVKEQP